MWLPYNLKIKIINQNSDLLSYNAMDCVEFFLGGHTWRWWMYMIMINQIKIYVRFTINVDNLQEERGEIKIFKKNHRELKFVCIV